MVEFNVDASEVDDVTENILALMVNLQQTGSSMQDEEPKKMRNEILTSVRENFDDVRTNPEQTSLLEAFRIQPSAFGKMITTAGVDADHAIPLERGITKHQIPKPKDSATLAFQPEDISDYPESSKVGGGFVVLDNVSWKPEKGETQKGYNYIYEAQTEWDKKVRTRFPEKIKADIVESGFTPE